MEKKTKIIIAVTAPIGLLLTIAIAFLIYLSVYMEAINVEIYFKLNNEIKITETKKYIQFESQGRKGAFIFYPGAKIEPKAYTQLMYQLAKNDIDCYIMKMPFNMAIFDVDAADRIIKKDNYSSYYLSGHSMGGAMISRYLKKKDNPKIKGLVLLAAYSDKDLSNKNISVLFIYGSEDKILSMKKVIDGRNYMPNDYNEVVIKGGNHANYGSYGEQTHDGKALISKDEK